MKSIQTKIRESIRNLILFLDYLFWWFFDFSKFKRIKINKIKKVLIIHKGAIGEILISTPIMATLKENLKCEITYMLNAGKEEVLKNNPYVDKIITFSEENKKNVQNIKKGNFDLAIILFPCSFKLSKMCSSAGIKYKIGGFAGIKTAPCFRFNKRTFPIKYKHAIEKNLDVIRLIGLEEKNPKIELYLTPDEKIDVGEKLAKLKIKDYMVVHPGFSSILNSKYPSRLWPLENYAKVIDHMIKKYNIKVILTGSESEKVVCAQIKQKVENKNQVIISNGSFNLRQLFAAIANAKLLLSGGVAVHIAAAFNTPTVAFEGKSSPVEWHPWNSKKNYILIHHPEVCTECDREVCRKKTQECLKTIISQEVTDAIDELWRKNYSTG